MMNTATDCQDLLRPSVKLVDLHLKKGHYQHLLNQKPEELPILPKMWQVNGDIR